MLELDAQLKELQQVVQLLLKQYHFLQKENSTLKEELQERNLVSSQKDESMQQLQQKLEASRLGLASIDKEDKHFLQKRIDSYLAEIEKCISALNV